MSSRDPRQLQPAHRYGTRPVTRRRMRSSRDRVRERWIVPRHAGQISATRQNISDRRLDQQHADDGAHRQVAL
jgi:hypothetical protein